VITHSAFAYARAAILDGDTAQSKFSYYVNWKCGRRDLLVFDECPPLVRQHKTTRQEIGFLHGVIRNVVSQSNRHYVEALDAYLRYVADTDLEWSGEARNLCQEEHDTLSSVNTQALIE